MRVEARRPVHRPRGHDEIDVPRLAVRALILLMAFTLAAAAFGRWSGQGVMLQSEAAAVETRELRFEEAGAELRVVDAMSGQVVALLSTGQDGFIRGVLRGLTRGRVVNRVDGGDVFVLTRWDDGRLSITDPASGERFDLNAFGKDNLTAFARLLKSQEDRP